PGWPEGAALEENTSLLDLAPTILGQATEAPGPTAFEGRDLAPLAKGEAVDWPTDVLCEYTAEGCDEPWLMLRRGSRKMIWSETHGPQLFELVADPHEARDLARLPEHAAEVAAMIAAIRTHWDVECVNKAALESQKRRHMLRDALCHGQRPPWDWQPPSNAAKQYVRSGDSPTLTKIRSHLPYRAPVPPDHPRKTEDKT
ncbi:MAG: hypothetical protein WCP77_19255, partial [Roseococcus sp.]